MIVGQDEISNTALIAYLLLKWRNANQKDLAAALSLEDF